MRESYDYNQEFNGADPEKQELEHARKHLGELTTINSREACLLDSGAKDHIISNLDALRNVQNTKKTTTMVTADGTEIDIKFQGDFLGTRGLYVKQADISLISIGKICDETGRALLVTSEGHFLTERRGYDIPDDAIKLSDRGPHTGELYKTTLDLIQKDLKDVLLPRVWEDQSYAYSARQIDQRYLCHARFGHCSNRRIMYALRSNPTIGLKVKPKDFSDGCGIKHCNACRRHKATRSMKRPRNAIPLLRAPGHISVDTMEIGLERNGSPRYLKVFVDDRTRLSFAVPSINRTSQLHIDDLQKAINFYNGFFRNFFEPGTMVHTVKSDNAAEFLDKGVVAFLSRQDITTQTTVAHCSAQNARAESRIRSVREMTRTMLSVANVPTFLWTYCALHAVYLMNILPTKALGYLSPYEYCTHQKPNLRCLRIWGSTAVVHTRKHISKRDPLPQRTSIGLYIGFDNSRDCILVYYPSTGKIVRTLDFHVDERTWTFTDQRYEEMKQGCFKILPGVRGPPGTEERQKQQEKGIIQGNLDARAIENIEEHNLERNEIQEQEREKALREAQARKLRIDEARKLTRQYQEAILGNHTEDASSKQLEQVQTVEPEERENERALREQMYNSYETTSSYSDKRTDEVDANMALIEEVDDAAAQSMRRSSKSSEEVVLAAAAKGANKENAHTYTTVKQYEKAWRAATKEQRARPCTKSNPWGVATKGKTLARHIPVPPKNPDAATNLESPHARYWIQALEKELKSLKEMGVYESCTLPRGARLQKATVVFKAKCDGEGRLTRFKARVCVQGFREVKWIDYFDSYAPTMRDETFKLLLSICARGKTRSGKETHFHLRSADVETAFLQADQVILKYLRPIKGMQIKNGDDAVVLRKSLYGSHDSAYLFNQLMLKVLTKVGFSQAKADCCLFTFTDGKEVEILLGIYVDDLIIVTNSLSVWEKKLGEIKKRVKISEEGECALFLQQRLTRYGDGSIFIDQQAKADEIVENAELGELKPRKTPGEHRPKLSKDDCASNPEELKAAEEYSMRRRLGELGHLCRMTRPDVQFATYLCAQFQHAPGKPHREFCTGIQRYLKGSTDLGILMQHKPNYDGQFENSFIQSVMENSPLCCFVDAAHIDDEDERKSSYGYIFFSYGNPIYWKSKKSALVCLSSTEAESDAAVQAWKVSVGLRALLADVGIKVKTIPVMEDNQAVIKLVEHAIFRKGSVHFQMRLHCIREAVGRGDLDFHYIRTNDNLADIFTKCLPLPQHERLRNGIMSKLDTARLADKPKSKDKPKGQPRNQKRSTLD